MLTDIFSFLFFAFNLILTIVLLVMIFHCSKIADDVKDGDNF